MDDPASMKQRPTKSSILQNLKEMVTLNKHDLEKGDVPLCLTPEVLLILNHGFEHLGDTRNGGDKAYRDLDYLQKAFNLTHYLRLSHGGNSTIQAPVDLSAFHHLSQLDIKRIPIHWIVGLNKFQDKLTLVRMSRSINFLEDLLGKSSDPDALCLAWSKLKKLYLSNNFLKHLDESLKLLPCLEVLDLSQNYLSATEGYLQYLTELQHLNMSYNSLTVIPAFSPQTHLKLRTLVLRANHIEQLNGVESLRCLETLDMTSNILCDHGILLPLYSISTLTQLYLEDNPLSHNSRHRALTGAILSHQVVKKLVLDGQAFTDDEIRAAAVLRDSIRPSVNGNAASSSQPGCSSSPLVKRRVKMNEIKDIQDIPQPNDDLDGPLSTDSLTMDSIHSETFSSLADDQPLPAAKSRIETLREEFGDSWLQSYNGHPSVYKQAVAQKPVSSLVRGAGENPFLTEGDNSDPPTVNAEGGAEVDVYREYTEEAGSRYDSVDEADDELPGDSRYGSVASRELSATDNESVYSAEGEGHDNEDMNYDPFIVKLPVIDAEEFLITVTKKQVVEKSIEGVITEMLDLAALLEVEHCVEDDKQMIRCKFDYFRKDRRDRCYVMEDLTDAMNLMDILAPIVAVSQSARKTTSTSECLKCGKQFMVKKPSRKGGKISCTHCGSDMVVELTSARGSQSTPCSSSNSSPSTSPEHKTAAASAHANDVSASSELYWSGNDTSSYEETDGPEATTDVAIDTGNDWTSSQRFTESEELPPSPNVATVNVSDTLSYQSLENESVASEPSIYAEPPPDQHQVTDPLSGFKFDVTNLSYIDHRLKLHLTVSYFEDHEQPQCTVRCKCVEYTKPEEYPAVLVLTNTHIYVFRLLPAIRQVDTGAQFQLITRRLLSDILYVEIGLAHQNIRVEFDKSGYCVLFRDFQLGRLVHGSLSMLMSNSSFSEESKLKSIGKINDEYYKQLSKCVEGVAGSDGGERNSHFVSAFVKSADPCSIDFLEGCQPVSLLIDSTNVYVVKEKFHLPFTRNRLPKKQTCFTLETTIPIRDIAHLTINKETREVNLEGFEEQALEFVHKFVFTCVSSLTYFTESIESPWKAIYNVDLELNYSVQ